MTILGNKKLKVLSYLFEFIVLFASIYIAFELEEWDEEQDFTSREIAYLASMHQDLSKDLNQLNRRILEYDEKVESAKQVLELLKEPYEISRARILDEFETHLFPHFNYNPINNTLETLRTSGDLKLVKNHSFKILLSELDKSYANTVHQGEIFNDYIEGMEWSGFFINNFDTRNFEVFSKDPNFSTLFENRVRHYITLVESYYFQLQGSLKKTEEVKLALEEEMSRRNLPFDPTGESLTDPDNTELDKLKDELEDFIRENNDYSSPEGEPADFDLDKETDDLLNELDNMGN
ncbi:MAG: DUF6090 family protein [Bacteroidota bacterium]